MNHLDQKDTRNKPRYWGRVDTSACCDGVAEVRRVAIEDLKKYPDGIMTWPDISAEEFADAIKRHYNKMNKAGDPYAIDDETGCPHIWSIQFNAMCLEMKRREKCTKDTSSVENVESKQSSPIHSENSQHPAAVINLVKLTSFIQSKQPSILEEFRREIGYEN